MNAARWVSITMALCVGALAGSAKARAQEWASDQPTDQAKNEAMPGWPRRGPLPLPPGLRLHVEVAPGANLATSRRGSDGSQSSPSCAVEAPPSLCSIPLALGLGLEWSSVQHIGLGLRGRWVYAPANTSLFGRRLNVLEVLASPNVGWPWHTRIPSGGARTYFAVPVGLAWSFQSRNWERAVREDWNSRPGLSVGVACGLELFWGRNFGGLVELGYQARFLSADVVSTPLADPASKASERVTVTQHHLVLSLGILYGRR